MEAFSQRLEELERRLAAVESSPQAQQGAAADEALPPLSQSGGWECMKCDNVMKFLRSLQGEVTALRKALPMSDQVQALREAIASAQCSVDVMKSKTQSMERQIKDVSGHVDATHANLLDKLLRMENAMGYSLGTEIPAIRSDLKGLQIDLRAKQDSWLKEAAGKVQAMQSMPAWFARLEGDIQDRSAVMEADMKQKLSKMESRWSEKCSCFIMEMNRLVDARMESKLDAVVWEELKVDVEAAVMTLREMLRTQRVSMEGEVKALRSEAEVRALEVRGLAKDLRRLLVRGPTASDGLEGCTSYVVPQLVHR